METLGRFKQAIKGRELFIWCSWHGEDGEYFPISHCAFLRTIGADVPYKSDGLHNDTPIDYRVSEDGTCVYVN